MSSSKGSRFGRCGFKGGLEDWQDGTLGSQRCEGLSGFNKKRYIRGVAWPGARRPREGALPASPRHWKRKGAKDSLKSSMAETTSPTYRSNIRAWKLPAAPPVVPVPPADGASAPGSVAPRNAARRSSAAKRASSRLLRRSPVAPRKRRARRVTSESGCCTEPHRRLNSKATEPASRFRSASLANSAGARRRVDGRLCLQRQ
mmetsp:Transcript_130/g.538  ORF Transcript_130/g.538 Transcript_130/m.538 type:complete len:202 (+) Transcript_130:2-607(+)